MHAGLNCSLFMGILVLAGLPSRAQAEAETTFALASTWENRYVSQGRSNLDRGGIYTFATELSHGGLTAGTWYARGDSRSYQEWNLFAEYGLQAGPVQAWLGYTHLRFPEANGHDNELYAGAAIEFLPHLVPVIDYTHSTGAGGGFLELALTAQLSLLQDRLRLAPYLREGFDFGYISALDQGPKNLQLGLDMSFTTESGLSLFGSLNHSWAHTGHPDFADVTWLTIGVAYGR